MPIRYFEDFQPGETWESPPIPLSAQDIVEFGRRYDPQPMHTDAAASVDGPLGGLVASGFHIAALSMRAFVESGRYGDTPMVGLGVDELRWRAPARPGDTLTVKREVVELRRSASNPAHGVVRTQVTVRKQDGTTVMSLISAGRVPARPDAAQPSGSAA